MPGPGPAEDWKSMVLRSMAPPAWLGGDSAAREIVMSTRARTLRNLRGHLFPHQAAPEELRGVLEKVMDAVHTGKLQAGTGVLGSVTDSGFEVLKRVSTAERNYLVGCRLASPEFRWKDVGRALLLDSQRAAGIMVNEEDHLRIQALTPGWTLNDAEGLVGSAVAGLSRNLEFAWTPEWGFLAASPYNAGEGSRLSAMLHLIGLADAKRLTTVMRALASGGVVVRGLFGESSRAIGAFVQVSVTNSSRERFVGACEYLVEQERNARVEVRPGRLDRQLRKVRDFAIASRGLSLPDALRVIGWVRWAAVDSSSCVPYSLREVDSWLTLLELRGPMSEERAARERAEFLRTRLEPMRC